MNVTREHAQKDMIHDHAHGFSAAASHKIPFPENIGLHSAPVFSCRSHVIHHFLFLFQPSQVYLATGEFINESLRKETNQKCL